ncbi:MAG: putative dehydrogenase [Rhodothermales bacterium]|jgi:predicted dehydrogenase
MITRRRFCVSAAGAALGTSAQAPKRRVAAIGHTGRGNFGHGLDSVWLKMPGTEIVGVADASEKGLRTAQTRLGGIPGFADYRKMLAELRPEFVSVCPRYADQHRDMGLAAMNAGVKGLYMEKPWVRTPQETDELIAAAKKTGAKIAIAHRNRYHPVLATIDKLIAEGRIGRLLEIRARGKGDRRGGGQDLWVLGTHVLNLVHYFAGDPLSCSATMYKDGKRATKADIREGDEGVGPIAGNELHARFEMSKGIVAYFDSIANDGTKSEGFGLKLVGSKGTVNIQCDRKPLAHLWLGNPFQPSSTPQPWEAIPDGDAAVIASVHDHRAAVDDLITAVDEDREPLCGVRDGLMTVEMCCAVFESHLQNGAAVAIPLTKRDHPLSR